MTRAARALVLRYRGLSWATIGNRLGVSGTTANNWVTLYCQRHGLSMPPAPKRFQGIGDCGPDEIQRRLEQWRGESC